MKENYNLVKKLKENKQAILSLENEIKELKDKLILRDICRPSFYDKDGNPIRKNEDKELVDMLITLEETKRGILDAEDMLVERYNNRLREINK